jgi:hypothetical protein
LNKKYQDAYALKRYYVFAEDLVCKVEAESAAVVPEESQKIILRLSSSLMNSLLVALEYINENYFSNSTRIKDEIALRYYEYHKNLYSRAREYGNDNELIIYDYTCMCLIVGLSTMSYISYIHPTT